MSDTTIFGRTVSGSFKACCLYVLADLGVDFVKSMATMDMATWQNMWWMQKAAFWLSPIASAAVIAKAFYSNSK